MKRRALLQAFLALPVAAAVARSEVRAAEAVLPTLPMGYFYARSVKGAGVVYMVTSDKGWLPCDGRRLAISEYPLLFAVLDRAFGPTLAKHLETMNKPTFNLPDLRGEFILGAQP